MLIFLVKEESSGKGGDVRGEKHQCDSDDLDRATSVQRLDVVRRGIVPFGRVLVEVDVERGVSVNGGVGGEAKPDGAGEEGEGEEDIGGEGCGGGEDGVNGGAEGGEDVGGGDQGRKGELSGAKEVRWRGVFGESRKGEIIMTKGDTV